MQISNFYGNVHAGVLGTFEDLHRNYLQMSRLLSKIRIHIYAVKTDMFNSLKNIL